MIFTNLKTYFPQRHVMHQTFVATVEFKEIKNAKDGVYQFMISIMVRKIVIMDQMKESQVAIVSFNENNSSSMVTYMCPGRECK